MASTSEVDVEVTGVIWSAIDSLLPPFDAVFGAYEIVLGLFRVWAMTPSVYGR